LSSFTFNFIFTLSGRNLGSSAYDTMPNNGSLDS